MEPCHLNSSLKPPSPQRTTPKLRIYASVSKEDVNNERVTTSASGEQIAVGGKPISRSAFDHVFLPECSQKELCSKFLTEMINSVFAGQDATFISIGSKSHGKEQRLYGDGSAQLGIFQSAVIQLMGAVEETKKEDERLQMRMSAVLVSQREATIVDLLSPFNIDPRRRSVGIVDDPRKGVYIENESEIRVDSIDQALFYLSTVVDHRLIQDEQAHRTSHVFISFTLYSYSMHDRQLQGGRRRFSFLDLGIGERNSTNGGLTLPSIGCILLAIMQRNKHVPSKETRVGQLLRCALATSRFDVFFASFAAREDDNTNVAQLAAKLARIRKNSPRKHPSTLGDDVQSGSSNEKRRELESGSELSGAETVIFLGSLPGSASPRPQIRSVHRTARVFPESTGAPSAGLKASHCTADQPILPQTSIPPMLKGHTPFISASLRLYDELCSPPGSSTMCSPQAFGGNSFEDRSDFGVTIANYVAQSKSKFNLDDGKRQQILQWMEKAEAPPTLFNALDIAVDETRECGILSHPLEDIIEQEEESLRTSVTRSTTKKDHPLRILSQQNLDKIDGSTPKDDETLEETAMVASISSIKSHEILAKLDAMRGTVSMPSASVSGHSEMDMYRRASHLEEYAMQRIKEIENENRLAKKKKKKLALNCCQKSMISSSSTVVDWSGIERRREEEKDAADSERHKEELRERREKIKMEELELRRERSLIDKELDQKRSLATTLARQLHNFSLSPCRVSNRSRSSAHADSLPSTPMTTHKANNSSSSNSVRGPWSDDQALTFHQSLPRHSNHPTRRATHVDADSTSSSRRPSKSRLDKEKHERHSSEPRAKDESWMRSPYSQVTSPKVYGGPGTSSSGRGSDDAASLGRDEGRRMKRQSYSASSGYESATGDYHVYTKLSLFDKRANDEKFDLVKHADHIRQRQRQLKKQLEDAKRLIGQVDDARSIGGEHKSNGLSRTTLVDALLQENRILEKRLIACRNHTMLVTAFV